ncbi:hypothetical protein [Paraburkholderia tropica]|uniref:hypothetical protein n=1 Tax=Paraburkholderia tropica TaxID=92647 RepID=UPI003D2C2151
MKPSNVLAVLLLSIAVAPSAMAEEVPLFAHFKDVPLDSSPVEGYVLFGDFQDGQPMIRAVTASTAVFYEREELLKGPGGFARNLLDCRKATLKTDAFGDLESLRIETRSLPVEAHSIRRMHPKNLVVLARVCKAAGLRASW